MGRLPGAPHARPAHRKAHPFSFVTIVALIVSFALFVGVSGERKEYFMKEGILHGGDEHTAVV